MENITGSLNSAGAIAGALSARGNMEGAVRLPERVGTAYAGPYEVTPGDVPVVLATEGRYAVADIIVKPVPSSYGRIAWNGTALTVF